MKFFNNYFTTIGNTPLVELRKINRELKNGARLFVKVESRNPAFSIKDRIGYSMIMDALNSGKLKEGMTIIEPTSGNTGIALCMVGKRLGFDVAIVMPESMSVERRALMKMFGADLILTPAEKGMKGAIDEVVEMVNENPEKYFYPSQFDNPANPKIHEATTGPEIFYAMNGEVDVFIAGVGTGGTISGVSRFLKKASFRKVYSVAVEPENSPAITAFLNNERVSPKPHKIQGIGAGFVPENLDLSVVDEVLQVSDEEAFSFARKIARDEGILCGISSGANLAAAFKIAMRDENTNKNIVFVAPDTGERYLSTDLFKNI